jgi:hypothetical protein
MFSCAGYCDALTSPRQPLNSTEQVPANRPANTKGTRGRVAQRSAVVKEAQQLRQGQILATAFS